MDVLGGFDGMFLLGVGTDRKWKGFGDVFRSGTFVGFKFVGK